MILEGLQDKKTWNAIQTKFGHKATTEIHGGWIHYLDGDMKWQDIDCLFVKGLYGFDVEKAPFTFHAPLFSDEEAYFNINNKFDVFKKETIEASDFGQHITPLGVFRVEGQLFDINGDGRLDAVKYPDAYGTGVHLVYYVQHGNAPRVKKLVMFDSQLLEDRDFSFQLRYTERPEISPKYRLNQTRISLRDTTDTMLDLGQPIYANQGFYVRQRGESQKRGIGIKTPLIWDSGDMENKKVSVVETEINRQDLKTYILTKHIKASFFMDVQYPVFTDTTSTFYPDPHPETTTVDGYVLRGGVINETWSNIIANAGNEAQDGFAWLTTGFRTSTTTNQFQYNIRTVMLFDTSSIGTDSISSAKITGTVRLKPDDNSDNPSYMVVSTSPASDTALVTADYGTLGGTKLSDEITHSSLPAVDSTFDYTFNATGVSSIDKAGISKFGTVTNRDFNDVMPNWGGGAMWSYVQLYSADEAVINKRPKLVVVHSVPRTVGRGRTKNLHRKATGFSSGLN